MSHLKIKNLEVYYKNTQVIKSLNLTIPSGEMTAIIGPSGCGKTTLLKSLNRLLKINTNVKVKGQVLIDNQNIYSDEADLLVLRRKIGYLSQRPCSLPYSIYKNISFGIKIHKMKSPEIQEIIKKIDHDYNYKNLSYKEAESLLVQTCLQTAGLWEEVKDRLNSPAHHLSIGQQQRLALARTLSVGPEVILADEPTSALDPISTQLIEKKFIELKNRFDIIMVTHILRQAKKLADNVVFLYMGELIETGPAQQVLYRPQQAKTLAYINGDVI